MQSRLRSLLPLVLACLLLLSVCTAADSKQGPEAEQPELSREEQLAALRDIEQLLEFAKLMASRM